MARTARTRRVVLIGFMGAGKTSVGSTLARRLGWRFQDLDQIIELRQGKPVAQIFSGDGETAFRQMESAALNELLAHESDSDNLIVALGGGAFTRTDNREAIRRSGAITVLLEAPLEELRRRCLRDGVTRPLARDEQEFAKLFANRQAAYQQAQFRVTTTNRAVDEIAVEVEQILATQANPEVIK